MSAPRQVFVAVIGAGGVGKAFLKQLPPLADKFSRSHTLTLTYLSTSKRALYHKDYQSILTSWESSLQSSTTSPLPTQSLIEYLSKAPGSAVLVDNTSDQQIAESYPSFLEHGISIVTPNKKAFSGSDALFRAIYASAANDASTPDSKAGYVFHESSVGAGLPVLSTLKELLDTGDRVLRIEGVFSGTMSFLFNQFQPAPGHGSGGKFSAEVAAAKAQGFTEPDPRDDLNGLDVARKLTILARLAGLDVESPTSFAVQSLIPAALESCASGDEFLARLPDFDADMDRLKEDAAAQDKVVRFVGSVDVAAGTLNVGLDKFDASHPIAALKGSDNIIAFYTERYGANPLIVQGAGAGADVTAMGVTGDLVRVLRLLR